MIMKHLQRSAIIAAMAAILLSCSTGDKTAATKEIILLCGGSMRGPMETVIAQYNAKHKDIKVLASYGGSGELMAQLQQTSKGDIYVCHDPYIDWGVEKGLIDRYVTVAYLDVVIAVPKGNPKNITGLHDLARPGLRIGLGDQRYSTSGQIITNILAKVPYGDSIRANTVVETKGHQQRATDVTLGNLDATIIWNAVATLYTGKLDTISVSKEHIDAVTSATYGTSDLRKVKVTVGVTVYAKDKKHVAQFYDFIAQESPHYFAKTGMTPLEGSARGH